MKHFVNLSLKNAIEIKFYCYYISLNSPLSYLSAMTYITTPQLLITFHFFIVFASSSVELVLCLEILKLKSFRVVFKDYQ